MKKLLAYLIFPAFAMFLSMNVVLPQDLYLRANAGYGITMSPQNLYEYGMSNYTSSNNTSTLEVVNISLGKGFEFGGAIGVMYNSNLGAELGASYLMGAKATAFDEVDDYWTTSYTMHANMIKLRPAVVIASGFEKLDPYARLGLEVASGNVFFEYEDTYENDVEYLKMKMNDGWAVGLHAGLGLQMNVNEHFSLFGEITSSNLSYAPTKGEIIEATWNGEDELVDYDVSEKEFRYVDKITWIDDEEIDPDEPSEELKYHFPFGNIALKVGFKVSF